jgi:hypothetical protein
MALQLDASARLFWGFAGARDPIRISKISFWQDQTSYSTHKYFQFPSARSTR